MSKIKDIFAAVAFIILAGACNSHDSMRNTALRELECNFHFEKDSVQCFVDSALLNMERKAWYNEYSDADYLNYLLCPQVCGEPVSYYWMWHIKQWLNMQTDVESVVLAAQEVNKSIKIKIYPENYRDERLGYTETIARGVGKCDDRAILTVMALRANGIPASFDYIPYWGSNNNGHSFATAIMPDGTQLVFQSEKDNGFNPVFANKVTKIYRNVGGNVEDVTGDHAVGSRDVVLNNSALRGDVSLAVFSVNGWQEIMKIGNVKQTACFKSVGTGTLYDGSNPVKGQDIGDGIIYLPCCMTGNETVPILPATIVNDTFEISICPDYNNMEQVRLHRKYPLLDRLKIYSDYMTGAVFEASNSPDFSDSEIIYEISDTPECGLQFINVSIQKKYRYIRYRKDSGIFSIADMMVFDENGQKIDGRLFTLPYLERLNSINNAVDGDLLTYFELPLGKDLWLGIDLGTTKNISSIAFAPRNDDNNVCKGDLYELLYWDDQWISCGIKTAVEYNNIEFENVPKGALLWLKNLTKGKEERPFLYVDGRQIWY